MLRRIPLPTFYAWMDYAKRNPFGEERADLRAGLIASEVANSQHFKHPRAMRPIDFMPFSKGSGARTKQTPTQMLAVLKGIASLHKQAGKASNSSKNAAKGPRIDDRGSDGLIDPENA